jgi:hypothetical protein
MAGRKLLLDGISLGFHGLLLLAVDQEVEAHTRAADAEENRNDDECSQKSSEHAAGFFYKSAQGVGAHKLAFGFARIAQRALWGEADALSRNSAQAAR